MTMGAPTSVAESPNPTARTQTSTTIRVATAFVYLSMILGRNVARRWRATRPAIAKQSAFPIMIHPNRATCQRVPDTPPVVRTSR